MARQPSCLRSKCAVSTVRPWSLMSAQVIRRDREVE